MPVTMPPFDRAKARAFLVRVMTDVGAAMLGGLSFLGDRLGIFTTLAASGPVTVEELAERSGLQPRYLREWLNAMTAAQYLEYDPGSRRYRLPREHAATLAEEDSPFFLGGFLEMIVPSVSQAPRLLRAFREGGGVAPADFPEEIFEGIERASLPWYRHKLVPRWLPALPEAKARLEAGGRVLDVGCGSGRAAIALAQGFPRARVLGLDAHRLSIERARANAREAGVEERVRFEVRDATALAEGAFDLVCAFDVVHDAPHPAALLSAVRGALAPGGSFLMLELNCSGEVQENVNPLGQLLYSMSTLYCLTQSLAQGGEGIGAAMGEARARELAEQAGFGSFRRLPLDEPFCVLYELRA